MAIAVEVGHRQLTGHLAGHDHVHQLHHVGDGEIAIIVDIAHQQLQTLYQVCLLLVLGIQSIRLRVIVSRALYAVCGIACPVGLVARVALIPDAVVPRAQLVGTDPYEDDILIQPLLEGRKCSSLVIGIVVAFDGETGGCLGRLVIYAEQLHLRVAKVGIYGRTVSSLLVKGVGDIVGCHSMESLDGESVDAGHGDVEGPAHHLSGALELLRRGSWVCREVCLGGESRCLLFQFLACCTQLLDVGFVLFWCHQQPCQYLTVAVTAVGEEVVVSTVGFHVSALLLRAGQQQCLPLGDEMPGGFLLKSGTVGIGIHASVVEVECVVGKLDGRVVDLAGGDLDGQSPLIEYGMCVPLVAPCQIASVVGAQEIGAVEHGDGGEGDGLLWVGRVSFIGDDACWDDERIGRLGHQVGHGE